MYNCITKVAARYYSRNYVLAYYIIHFTNTNITNLKFGQI